MVAAMLMALLAAGAGEAAVTTGLRATAVTRASVTIRHAVTLRRAVIDAQPAGTTAQRRAPRACAPAEAGPACRLIVYDLP